MQSDEKKASQTWTDGGLEVGLDYGKALTLIFITGIIHGLYWLLPAKPKEQEESPETRRRADSLLRYHTKNWYQSMNPLQKGVSLFIRFLESALLAPLTRLAERAVGPACAYLFAGVALWPAKRKGSRNISLRHIEYHWAMDFVNNHAGKVAWSTMALGALGLLLGIFIPFIMSSKIAITAYFLGIFFLPVTLSHLFIAFAAGTRGLWHLLSPLLLTSQSDADRIKWTYRGEHIVQNAFKKEPDVAKRLNAFFKKQTEETAEYTRQQALLVGESSRDKKSIGGLFTVAGLQREQEGFIQELQKMKPKERLQAIERKEETFKARVTWA